MRPLIYMIGAAAQRPPYTAKLAWDAEFFNLQENEDYYPDGVRNPFSWVPDQAYLDDETAYRATCNGVYSPELDPPANGVIIGKNYNQAGMLVPDNPNLYTSPAKPGLSIAARFRLYEGSTVVVGHKYALFAVHVEGEPHPLLQAHARMQDDGATFLIGFSILNAAGELEEIVEYFDYVAFGADVDVRAILKPDTLYTWQQGGPMRDFPATPKVTIGRRSVTLFDNHGQYDVDRVSLQHLLIEAVA